LANNDGRCAANTAYEHRSGKCKVDDRRSEMTTGFDDDHWTNHGNGVDLNDDST